MKKKLLIFITVIISLQVYSQKLDTVSNYWPLNKENRWYYLTEDHVYSEPWVKYGVEEVSYTHDTTINSQIYFNKLNKWMRYDNETNEIVSLKDFNESVFMDFNLSDGNNFIQFNSPFNYINQINARVVEAKYRFLSDSIRIKGFIAPNSELGQTQIMYAKNIGEVYIYNSTAEIIHYDNYAYLIEALIHRGDSTIIYDDKTPPQIIFTPPDSVSDTTITFRFEVKHPYTVIKMGANPANIPRHFIDSVIIQYFYEKGNNRFYEQKTLCNLEDERSDFYVASINLNKSLINNGFEFKYKIIAKDKGLFPEYDIEPDSGFYTTSLVTSVNNKHNLLKFNLSQNYPNPFNPSTTISYSIPKESFVTLKIYDVLGRELQTLVTGEKPPGKYKIIFYAKKYSSGIYFYVMHAGDFIETKKLILVK